MGAITNNEATTTEPLTSKGQQPKPLGSLNAFYWCQIFALDYELLKHKKMLSSHGGFVTIAMYHHRKTI